MPRRPDAAAERESVPRKDRAGVVDLPSFPLERAAEPGQSIFGSGCPRRLAASADPEELLGAAGEAPGRLSSVDGGELAVESVAAIADLAFDPVVVDLCIPALVAVRSVRRKVFRTRPAGCRTHSSGVPRLHIVRFEFHRPSNARESRVSRQVRTAVGHGSEFRQAGRDRIVRSLTAKGEQVVVPSLPAGSGGCRARRGRIGGCRRREASEAAGHPDGQLHHALRLPGRRLCGKRGREDLHERAHAEGNRGDPGVLHARAEQRGDRSPHVSLAEVARRST